MLDEAQIYFIMLQLVFRKFQFSKHSVIYFTKYSTELPQSSRDCAIIWDHNKPTITLTIKVKSIRVLISIDITVLLVKTLTL